MKSYVLRFTGALKSRRSQSSVEFLMTYGWAILVTLVAMVVAWQWGLFSITGDIQPGYFGFWGVVPKDFKMTSDGYLTISLINTVGANITVEYINASMGSCPEMCNWVDPGILIEPGDTETMDSLFLVPGNSGSRFEAFVVIEYTDIRMPGEQILSSGRIWGSYEQ